MVNGHLFQVVRKTKKEDSKLEVAWSVACWKWNIRTMQDSEDCPQRCSALMARKLTQMDIDIAALSKVPFAKQGSLTEDVAGYILL